MEETGLLRPSNNSHDVVPTQYVPTQNIKSYHQIANVILANVFLAVSLRILHKDSYTRAFGETVSAVSFITLIFGLSEILVRFFHCLMELSQLYAKYDGNVERVLKSLNLNTPSWIILVSSFAVYVALHSSAGNTVDRIWSLGPAGLGPAFLISVLLSQMTGLRDSTLNTALAIDSMGGVDYGTGMAYSYYYGYLNIVLPSDGGYNIGLLEKMKKYETDEGVSIPVKKLFILIPKSGYIPPDLKEASNDWMETTDKEPKGLESVVVDRAGVSRRTYKNVVYKIYPGGQGAGHRPVYVTTEGATPMLTFWQILKDTHPQTAAYRDHQLQIVASFYETLQMLLNNDPRCGDVCELVFYNDRDANGKKANVGEILLSKIRELAPSST